MDGQQNILHQILLFVSHVYLADNIFLKDNHDHYFNHIVKIVFTLFLKN